MFQKLESTSTQQSTLTNLGSLMAIAKKKKLQVCASIMNKGNGNFVLLKDANEQVYVVPASKSLTKGQSTNDLFLYQTEDDNYVVGIEQGSGVEWV